MVEGHDDWGRRAVPLLNYILAFALKLRNSTRNISWSSRVVRLLIASTGLLSISSRLPVGAFSRPLIGTGISQVVEIRGSLHQITLSRNSQIGGSVGSKVQEDSALFSAYRRQNVLTKKLGKGCVSTADTLLHNVE
jgi:hypothetical protein